MKNDVINDGIYKSFLELKHEFYLKGVATDVKENYLDHFNREQIDICFSIYNSVKQRKTRNLDKIIQMSFAKDCIEGHKDDVFVFLTLTFTDGYLASTSRETRRRYVQRFLQKNSTTYFANIDFGEKNGREHYHAVILSKNKINPKKWSYGNLDIRTIGQDKNSLKRVKNYILKINNHSYKDSTNQIRLIYPKRNLIYAVINWIYPNEYQRYKKRWYAEQN